MPEIPDVTSVIVTAEYRATDGRPLYGSVTFTPPDLAVTDAAVVMPSPVVARVVAGRLAVSLAVSDDPDLAPDGWAYTVEEDFGGEVVPFEITLTSAMAPSVELNSIAPWPRPPASSPPPAGVEYVASVNGRQGAVVLAKSDVGLGDVDNTADDDKPISAAAQVALDEKAALDDLDGKQDVLPSGAADEFLRGSDKTFVAVSKSDVGLGDVDNTADTDKPISSATQAALDDKQDSLPSGTTSQFLRGDLTFASVTKSSVGLGNVDNTSDANKPISSATQSALNGKQGTLPSGGASQFLRGSDKTFVAVTKSDVGLANVDNTSDANKPVSSATQTALNGKQASLPSGSASQFLRGSDKTFVAVTKSDVGLGNVDNTADSSKPVSTAQQAALNGKLSLTGGTVTGAVLTSAGGQAGAGAQPLTTVAYVQSREENLIANGSGLLGNNYNFAGLAFDPTIVYAGGGSFRSSTMNAFVTNDELIPVTPTSTYRLSVYAISSTYAVGATAYIGVAPYDIDGSAIAPNHYMKYTGSTDTTLAANLNPGDTTVQLTDATGWYNSALSSVNSHFAWYGYTNAKGYTYPNYTYTRLSSVTYKSGGWWASGGISGNTVTLNGAWSGPAIAAGTAVRNSSSGSTYKYVGASNVEIPASWTQYSGYIGGFDTGGTGGTNLFPYGTAYIRLVFLLNRTVAGNVTNLGPISFTSNATASAVLLRSPNGTAYQVVVSDGGVLSASAL